MSGPDYLIDEELSGFMAEMADVSPSVHEALADVVARPPKVSAPVAPIRTVMQSRPVATKTNPGTLLLPRTAATPSSPAPLMPLVSSPPPAGSPPDEVMFVDPGTYNPAPPPSAPAPSNNYPDYPPPPPPVNGGGGGGGSSSGNGKGGIGLLPILAGGTLLWLLFTTIFKGDEGK